MLNSINYAATSRILGKFVEYAEYQIVAEYSRCIPNSN